MATVKLIPYYVRIKEKYLDKYLDITQIETDDGKKSLLNIIHELCVNCEKNVYLRDAEKKTLFIDNTALDLESQRISAMIKSGEYGFETDFYDTIQMKHIPSARKKEHSEEKPFFFLFSMLTASNSDRGILILQTFKQFGVKYIFENALREEIKKIDDNLLIEINPIINSRLLDEIQKNDRIVELRLIKKQIPKDIGDKNLIDNYEDVKEERSFKVKKNKDIKFKAVKDKICESLKNIEYPYLEVEGEKYDEVKIVLETGKAQKTISLKAIPEFRESMPLIDDELQFSRGFPTKDSILPWAIEYVNGIKIKINENPLSE